MNTVNTILELRSLSGAAGDSVVLLGYYEKGDKSPVTYFFKTGNFTDDGGSIIVPSGSPAAGAWVAIFNAHVFIEDFGVSETNSNNSQSLLNAIKINKKLISQENKKYLINTTLTVNEIDIDISLGKNTVFYSMPVTTTGIAAKKIFDISNAGFVSLKGIFDGGYKKDGVFQGNPQGPTSSSSSLLQIKDCLKVTLAIQIQNFASNWNSSTLDTILNYGAIYVRGCEDVRCVNSVLTTSRIEGFVFLGNKNVVVDRFKSTNNVSIWTPLHCFFNDRVDIVNCTIDQPSDTKGSSINSYNNFTSFSNNFIHGGAGIDFRGEVDMDISIFNIKPVKIIVKDNIIKNCDYILASLYHIHEEKKLHVGVFRNYFINTARNMIRTTGVIRVDACDKVDIHSNIVKTTFVTQGFFQSVGDLDDVSITGNLVSSEFFLRLTEAGGKKYGNIDVNKNIFNALPLNGRSESDINSFSSFAYINMVSQSIDRVILSSNIINAEGRVFWLGGSYTMDKVQLTENIIKSPHKVSYLISNINELTMFRNKSFNCDVFSTLSNLNNSTVDVRENIEYSDIAKNRGMFNSLSGSLKSFTFINNKFNVPNPNTYGIINNISSLTSVLEKKISDNSPEVAESKTLVSSTKYGTTLNRPTNKVRNYDGYFDTNLNKYIFWTGTQWKDTFGNIV